MRVLKRSTARTIAVFLTDSSDHITGKTGATLTVTASKAGAAFASISPTVTELSSGWYSVALTTSHTDTFGDLAIHATASGADPIDLLCQVVAYDPFDAVRIGMTALPNASPGSASGLLQMSGSSSGTVSVLGGLISVSVGADGIGSSSIASGAYAAIASAVMTTQMTESYATDGTAPTPAQSLFLIQQHLGEAGISGTTKTVKKIDGSTTAATFTLNSSTAPTTITRAS